MNINKYNFKKVIPISRWVLITGCDSGFGYETTILLLNQGYHVISACLTLEGKETLINAVKNISNLITIKCDITNPNMVNELIEIVEKTTHGNLWALVNNAGISLPGYIDYLTLEEFRKVMEVNFFAGVNLVQKCLPMIKNSRGRIINVSSTCGLIALEGNAPYNTSKFALRGFTDTLRREMKVWDVKVSLIEPGVMKTKISTEYLKILEERYKLAPLSIQDSYGEEYSNRIFTTTGKQLKRIANDPKITVNAIFHAVAAKKPKSRYLTGFDAKYIFYPLSKYSNWFIDKMVKINGRKIPAEMSKKGKKIYEFSAKCNKNPEQTWMIFLEKVWKEGAELKFPMTIEQEGDKFGNLCTRWVKTFGKQGIREGIIKTAYPDYFVYKVLNPSKITFPVDYHQGIVRFLANSEGTTDVLWTIEVSPMRFSSAFVVSLFKYIIPRYLKYLENITQN